MSVPNDFEYKKSGDEVLKRMLKTPPDPKEKGDSLRRRPPVLDQDANNGSNTEKA